MELNHPLLRAPFEMVNKSFRLYHKQLTKELAAVTKSLTQLHDEQPPAQRMDVDALVSKLDELTGNIQRLKQDAKLKVADQQRDLELCLRRARYVKELAAAMPHLDPTTRAASIDDELKRSAQRTLNNRLITDYLLSRGHLASAAIVETRTGIDYLVDHDLHAECERIVTDLRAHSTARALAWCALNASRLRRLQSRLEFRLRLQEFIELVRAQQQLAAIEYAQTFVTPLALQREDPTAQRADLAEIEVAMGTLAFAHPEQSGQAHYAALFAANRWDQLVDSFTHTFRETYGLHDPSSLCLALYTGLSTLNTRTCARTRDALTKAKLARSRSDVDSDGDGDAEQQGGGSQQQDSDGSAGPQSKKTKRLSALADVRDEDASVDGSNGTKQRNSIALNGQLARAADSDVPICPACSELGGALCSGLPFAYHPHSRLVCRVTHKVMDEHNPPRVLPNGRVYSQEGIEQLLQRNERSGMVRCLETHELFAVSEIKPVYIL